MKAWRIYNFGDMRLDEIPTPSPEKGWALVKTEAFQPSVTEVMRFNGFSVEGIDKIKQTLHENGPSQLFGHEFCGEVVELGEGCMRVKVGDRVTVNTVRNSCGSCEYCLKSQNEDCLKKQWIGIDYPGCFAEYVVVPEELLRTVPNLLSINEVTCLQPLASVIANVAQANVKLGDTIAVLGLGVMGNSVAQVVRVSGAGKVIGSDVQDNNLELAKEQNIEYVVDARAKDVTEVVAGVTNGRGVDIVFECAGGSKEQGLAGNVTLRQAFDIVRKNGTVVQVAHVMPGGENSFDLKKLRSKNIRYIGSLPATDRHFYHGVHLIGSKRINISNTITHVLRGIENLPKSFEITGNKTKYGAMNPAQVIV